MKTAVEYLVHMYTLQGAIYLYDIEQSLEMEKGQIKNAYYTGGDDVEDNRDREAEQYYNETFKQ